VGELANIRTTLSKQLSKQVAKSALLASCIFTAPAVSVMDLNLKLVVGEVRVELTRFMAAGT
jgi:hypothetical protein